MIGVVGDDVGARPQAEDLGVERLGAVEQEQVDGLGKIEAGDGIVRAFMLEALPEASEATRTMAGALIKATLSQVGKRFSESPRTLAEIDAYADAMADMFCAYLRGLAQG